MSFRMQENFDGAIDACWDTRLDDRMLRFDPKFRSRFPLLSYDLSRLGMVAHYTETMRGGFSGGYIGFGPRRKL